MRREHGASLRAAYLAALHAAGVRGYSPRSFAADYRLATSYCLALAVNLGGAPGLETAPPRRRALAAAMARRAALAVKDAYVAPRKAKNKEAAEATAEA